MYICPMAVKVGFTRSLFTRNQQAHSYFGRGGRHSLAIVEDDGVALIQQMILSQKRETKPVHLQT